MRARDDKRLTEYRLTAQAYHWVGYNKAQMMNEVSRLIARGVTRVIIETADWQTRRDEDEAAQRAARRAG